MADSHELFPRQRVTNLPGGYMGKILRVDLTSGILTDENLPEEPLLRKFIGGQSLASYILLRELPLDATAFGPENKVVMMTGPITGTGLTPGGDENDSGLPEFPDGQHAGPWGSERLLGHLLKAAGYDGIIIEGVASRPTYLFINDGKSELRDAERVWGKGARATEDLLREEVGLNDAKVMCIGPAGENLNHAAMLVNDYNHNAAHSGGAVFGAKKLKAIVVCGTKRPPLYDKARLIEAGLRWRATLVQRRVEEKKQAGHGVDLGAIPNDNYRSSLVEDHGRGFDQNRFVLRPCFQCTRLCPWDVEIKEGSRSGVVGHFNAGSEWLDTFFNLGVKGNDVLCLAEKINDLGIECSHFSCGAGVMFEAWEKGALGPGQTDGLKLEWGNVDTVDRLLDMAARREGRWGNLLADGPTKVAEAIGGDAPT